MSARFWVFFSPSHPSETAYIGYCLNRHHVGMAKHYLERRNVLRYIARPLLNEEYVTWQDSIRHSRYPQPLPGIKCGDVAGWGKELRSRIWEIFWVLAAGGALAWLGKALF